jgi:RNA polymerase sigma factor (sigma-70 family)
MDAEPVSRPARAARLRVPARVLRIASDERLVELVRSGSEPAFEAVYDRHHRGVLSFCRHMLGSAEEAEDAVQHTFLAAYRDLLGSGKSIRLRPWLYAIARNRCLSMLRARREQLHGELVEPATENLSAEVQRREDLRAVIRDLTELPDDQRAALVLAELGAVSHGEIAEVLDCPREKVKALVFQARSSLSDARAAREASCAEIQEQLANLRGGALRRTVLRRHLAGCPACRAFRAELRVQRRALAILLPVVPSAGLKQAVLGSVLGGGGTAGGAAVAGGLAAAGGSAGAGGAGAVAAKALVAVCLAGGGTAATVSVARDDGPTTPAATAEARAPEGMSPTAVERVRSGARPAHPEPATEPGAGGRQVRRHGADGEHPGRALALGHAKDRPRAKDKQRGKDRARGKANGHDKLHKPRGHNKQDARVKPVKAAPPKAAPVHEPKSRPVVREAPAPKPVAPATAPKVKPPKPAAPAPAPVAPAPAVKSTGTEKLKD